MKLEYNLNLEQTQKLVMTPELRQAIQLLQFNSQELHEYLKNQIQENPMLDMPNTNDRHEDMEEIRKDKEAIRKDRDEIDWKEYIDNSDYTNYRPQRNRNEEQYNYENFIAKSESLKEHLLLQLNISKLDELDKKIGEVLIENIDQNGYLSGELDQIAMDLEMKTNDIKRVLHIIQTFEPLGVGARDLRECLLIQVRNEGLINSQVETVIEDYLQDIGNNRLTAISKGLGIEIEEVQIICDYIKSLEPKPGRVYDDASEDIRYITPDATIKLIDGEYIILLNDITAPRLSINNFYKNLIRQRTDSDTTVYLTEKLNSAMWIIQSIEQRRRTIYNVIKSILKFQKPFFEEGEMGLRPLTLKEVAEDISMHESTVSRATNGKYVQTPRGLYELKYFFTSGLSGGSEAMSSKGIKIIIKQLIEEENKRKPYSDQKIANILKEKGIDISRRTVAKYRDELGIPSSTMRKRY